MEKRFFSYVVWLFTSLSVIGCSLTSDFSSYKFGEQTPDASKGAAGGEAGNSSKGEGGANGSGAGGTTSEIDMCNRANTCGDHGKCDDSGGQIACICNAGYEGEHCEKCANGFVLFPKGGASCVENRCEPDPCTMAHTVAGGCVLTDAQHYKCTCLDGYRWDGTSCIGNCVDLDKDGYGAGPGCVGSDCNDNDPAVHPGVDEKCDGVDNNCDGRTDCAGGACRDKDPCVDQNPCTNDTCEKSGGSYQCQNKPWTTPADVACDPDADGTLTAADGVCAANATCARRNCRPCTDANQCAGGYCMCADENCSVKRCYDSPLTCQYLSGSDVQCAPTPVPAMRWGENCSGDETRSCDGAAVCQPRKCATCNYTGCTYTERHADCGNSEVCGKCGGSIDVCTHTASGTSCASSTDSSCDSRCDDNGQCISWETKACGGTDPCTGHCASGHCVFPSVTCGTAPCAGTCANGICNTNGTDCGTCCTCDASGTAKPDSSLAQSAADCPGYDIKNVCSNRCSTTSTSCIYPDNTVACGFGKCKGTCNGAGGCSSYKAPCCSKGRDSCSSGDICYGTCDVAGICSSYGNTCTGGLVCAAGTCGESGICHCDTTDCSVYVYTGSKYEYNSNLCSDGTCCAKSKFSCCPSALAICTSKACEHF